MKEFKKENIRNIAVIGHMGSGKTSLVEALAYAAKLISKKGEVEKKNTISDFSAEEQAHTFSTSTSLIPVEWNDTKINFLDIPGSNEFIADTIHCLSVCNGAILVIDASKGVEVGAVRIWGELREQKIPAIVFVNKMDKDNINFEDVLADIKNKLGKKALPFCYPIGHGANFEGFVNVIEHNARIFKNGVMTIDEVWEEKLPKINNLWESITESVAETSEELLDKYFSGEELSKEDIKQGLQTGLMAGDFAPVLCGAALTNVGVQVLLDMVTTYVPPITSRYYLLNDGETVGPLDENEPFTGYVFKTLIDPFVGMINFIHVKTGSLRAGQEVYLDGKPVKVSQLFSLMGKTQLPMDVAYAGDIVCASKTPALYTGATLLEKGVSREYYRKPIPNPTIFIAVVPKNTHDDDKISQALQKLLQEDESFELVRNKETKQLLIGGQGMMHISNLLEKLKNNYKVDVNTEKQKVVYRETFKNKVEAEGRYIKQSGGAGYYGVVKMSFEPHDGDNLFTEEIFGGSVPKGYFPAVEKGFHEALEHGPLAGYPVINIKTVLLDGKYHDVDSNELAFKNAAILAFKKASESAKKVLLEPIVKLEIKISDEYLGDVLGDINKRRGRVLGMDRKDEYQVVTVEVPEAEIISYTIDLKAMTQGAGKFKREFVRYEEVLPQIAEKIIQEARIED